MNTGCAPLCVGCRFGAAPAPVDGVVRLPLRLLDAPAAPEACGNATTPVCTLVDSTAASYSASRIACIVSPGVGTAFQLLIRDVWTTLVIDGVRAGFPAPQVTAVNPRQLPVEGGNVTVVGVGFGPGPCDGVNRTSDVRLLITAPPDPAGPQPVYDAATGTWGPSSALVASFVPCAVISWSRSAVVCAAPPGLDAVVAVRVSAGGQLAAAGQTVGYAPPAVMGVEVLQPLGTPGGGAVCVMGVDFPTLQWPLAVLVGGSVCAADPVAGPRNATTVCCRVPRGAGRAAVVVTTPLQTSAPVAGMHVVYAAPEVAEVVTPQGRSVDGGFPVIVRGVVRASDGVACAALFLCTCALVVVLAPEFASVASATQQSALCAPPRPLPHLCMIELLQNFFPGPIMEVTIGTQPCGSVVVTDNATMGEFACVAPPGPGFGAVQLRVAVEGSGTGAIRFAYDAPVVTRVLGSPCDAAATCPVQVRASVCLPSSTQVPGGCEV